MANGRPLSNESRADDVEAQWICEMGYCSKRFGWDVREFTMRALIVDDSRAIRRLVGEMMKQMGFEVFEARDGIEALQQLEDHGAPDIVLLDWNMPLMNGLEFTQAVRSHPEYQELPLMMVTTETEKNRMRSAIRAGVNEYVMKPFDKETIRTKLHTLGLVA